MCHIVWCTTGKNATNYNWIGPALDGTPCASGKVNISMVTYLQALFLNNFMF